MITTRPQSRESHTTFPAESRTVSRTTSERMGAFGALQLEHQPMPGTSNRLDRLSTPTHSRNQSAHSREVPPTPTPLPYIENGYTGQVTRPSQLPYKSEFVYEPSHAGTNDTRRKYDKLSEVYSTSGDTIEFTRNLMDYLHEKIHYGITVGILFILIIISFGVGLVGFLNLGFCPLQPMIPIWLAVSWILFMISAIFRIYHAIPKPTSTRRKRVKRTLSADLCAYCTEIMFAIANVVWLILGAVWVYGSRTYVHFNDQMFERHFCDPAVYWTAFVAVTGYMIFICILIVAVICLLCVGSYKETQNGNGVP